jgi:hypothetical protein
VACSIDRGLCGFPAIAASRTLCDAIDGAGVAGRLVPEAGRLSRLTRALAAGRSAALGAPPHKVRPERS